MKDAKTIVKHISVLMCVIYTIISNAVNVFCWVVLENSLPTIAFAFILLAVSLIISVIIVSIRKKGIMTTKKISVWLCRSACIYTPVLLFINTLVYMIESGKFFTLTSILLIIVFSLVVSACTVWIKPKKFIYGALLYFVITGVIYYLITVSIGGYGDGNKYIILIGAYIMIYFACTFICYLIKSSIDKQKQNNLPYKNQFDD